MARGHMFRELRSSAAAGPHRASRDARSVQVVRDVGVLAMRGEAAFYIAIALLILFFGPADCHKGDSVAMAVVKHFEQ